MDSLEISQDSVKLKLLKKLLISQEYISGETLANDLGISRTAIWKHIEQLRESGYKIEAQPRQGYRLLSRPQQDLSLEEIGLCLKTSWMGHRLIYLSETASTNDVAKQLARQEAAPGTVVLAGHQTHGKGRLGRRWISPPDVNLYFSIVLRPNVSPSKAAVATLVVAVAIVKAIREVAGIPATIKWPNDILCQGRKLVGILTEMSADMDRVHHIVVGIGINCNSDLTSLSNHLLAPATSITLETGTIVARDQLLCCCLEQLEKYYSIWIEQGFASIVDEWKRHSETLGKRIKVLVDDQIVEGTAVDLDQNGNLILNRENEIIRIIAGDVLV